MRRALDALPESVRVRVAAIACDSVAGAMYTLTLRTGGYVEGLERQIADAFLATLGGFNGLQIEETPRLQTRVPRGLPGPDDSAFYTSRAWRVLRYETLRKWGARCQCCGRTARHGAVIQVDHIRPRGVFPRLALAADNLQVLCRDCNLGKGAVDSTDWRPRSRFIGAHWRSDRFF